MSAGAGTELETIGASVDGIYDRIAELAAADDPVELARLLAEIRIVADLLRGAGRECESSLAEVMGDRSIEVPGVGMVERRKRTDRKRWDWDQLLPLLTRRWLDPDETGEMPDAHETRERMQALIRDVIGVTPSKAPKVTALRAADIDPDEYCESSPGGWSVQIHAALTEAGRAAQ